MNHGHEASTHKILAVDITSSVIKIINASAGAQVFWFTAIKSERNNLYMSRGKWIIKLMK